MGDYFLDRRIEHPDLWKFTIPRRENERNYHSNVSSQNSLLNNLYDGPSPSRQFYPTVTVPQQNSFMLTNCDSLVNKSGSTSNSLESNSVMLTDFDSLVNESGSASSSWERNPLKRPMEEPKTNKTSLMYKDTFPQNNSTLPKELTMQFQPLFCKLCTTKLSSNVMAKLHYNSRKHEKKVKMYLVEYSKRTGEPLHEFAKTDNKRQKFEEDHPRNYRCDICDLSFTGRMHAESHYMGKFHQKVLAGKSPAGKGFYDADGKWTRCVNDLATSRPDLIGIDFVPEVPEAKGKPLYCDVCCVSVTSHQQMTVHFEGQKHKKRVQQLAISNIDNIPKVDPENSILSALSSFIPTGDLSVYRTPSGYYYCSPCNLTLNSEVQFKQHLNSKKHRKKASGSKE